MSVLTLEALDAKRTRVARVMKTLGHPARLRIVELLLENGPMPVKDIFAAVLISQSNASQHLKALESLNLLSSTRSGKQMLYEIANPSLANLLACVDKCVDC
ncbi:MAG: metalloregulator ArsR/SmtB family transcription factor [Bacteroidota bacterium]